MSALRLVAVVVLAVMALTSVSTAAVYATSDETTRQGRRWAGLELACAVSQTISCLAIASHGLAWVWSLVALVVTVVVMVPCLILGARVSGSAATRGGEDQ